MATSNLDIVFINTALDSFSEILAPISAFAFTAAEQNANFGDQVKVVYQQHTSASSAFQYSTGYVHSNQTVVTGKDVTLDHLLYRTFVVSDADASKLTPSHILSISQGMGASLARDVISASLVHCVTEANFPTSASITNNELTSSLGWSELVEQADTLNWSTNRSLISNPETYGYVLQNPDINRAFAYGSDSPVQKGVVPEVFGASVHKYTGVFPVVAQPCKGLFLDPSAVVMAMGNHTPPQESKGLVNTLAVGTTGGLRLQLRTYYDVSKASTVYVVEGLFGCAVGNPTGLLWLK